MSMEAWAQNLLARGSNGWNDEGGSGHRLFMLLPELPKLNFGNIANLSPFALALNFAQPPINLNPSNVRGVIAKLLDALGIKVDLLAKIFQIQNMQGNALSYGTASHADLGKIGSPDTPGSGGGMSFAAALG